MSSDVLDDLLPPVLRLHDIVCKMIDNGYYDGAMDPKKIVQHFVDRSRRQTFPPVFKRHGAWCVRLDQFQQWVDGRWIKPNVAGSGKSRRSIRQPASVRNGRPSDAQRLLDAL